MSEINLYHASVPVFIRYLNQIELLLDKAKCFAKLQSMEEATLLAAGLADNMFPLGQQLSTAIGFSLRACCPLARQDIKNYHPESVSYDNLHKQIRETRCYLEQLRPEQFEGAEALSIATTAGFAELELTAGEYLQAYMLPNFFFHYSMCYAILRKMDCPLSKQDFDGFHQYPMGFSF
ncbi:MULTISPECIES: DUF1993 domain-containing protein [unclassified Agarivorans]|uniref:DUF1993 domain-containing protein n=1 Tax=unclassified Agarivorans TaxID=2636026 RepID=UPI0026E11AAC|nr:MULTISPECIES: DUF1993 domain-containing protein [unclassified Agarivorans]MDO6686494.1 DUF1993 domain-containing protein [Agarivorans sp. 3_MG-2023]MDO6715312.1 DUF1993 domain-containing protein [Agarivorans sp. 2_MG-2023]MDO6763372.1 DUF1993 domain-containing protein [Agarivorans sp. 1_MG-2023]